MPIKKEKNAEYMRQYRAKKKAQSQPAENLPAISQPVALQADESFIKKPDITPKYHMHRGRVYPGLIHQERKSLIIEEEDEDDYEESYVVESLPPSPPKLIGAPPVLPKARPIKTYHVEENFSCSHCGRWQIANLTEKCIQCQHAYKFDADRSHAKIKPLKHNAGHLSVCQICGRTHQIGERCIALNSPIFNVRMTK